ncbi:Transcription factor [Cardamine amara subsp. amara]|uniref:Transcription factor n=1 Tax=Cardamine amara subsp. amara TaxID=228776 RepID=A0ABD1BLI0_CARAN
MNRSGVLDSSPVQHLTVAGNPNWWTNVSTDLKPPPPLMSHQPPPTTTTATYLPSLLPNLFSSPTSSSASSSPYLHLNSNPNLSSWLETVDLPLDQPWSLSQLLLSGLVMGEEERMEMMNHFHHQNQQCSYQEKLENWEEPVLRHQAPMKQESNNNNDYVIMSSPNSPPNKSCVTLHNINEDNKKSIHENGLNLSECNSCSEIGGSSYAKKKPKLQVPSSQSTLKVRKEKLGGRIAALHQLVSPFGKTDTASVLSEAIGYIRFLHSQVEALSLPYFGSPSTNTMMHQHAQGDLNGIFPEAPGQLVNEYCLKISKGASSSLDNQESNPNEEPKKDLRCRGLCLVPVSCTLQVGSDNGADYWAPAFGFTFP